MSEREQMMWKQSDVSRWVIEISAEYYISKIWILIIVRVPSLLISILGNQSSVAGLKDEHKGYLKINLLDSNEQIEILIRDNQCIPIIIKFLRE